MIYLVALIAAIMLFGADAVWKCIKIALGACTLFVVALGVFLCIHAA